MRTLRTPDVNRSYFRLNISGMSWARKEMHRRGMIYDASCGTWPDYPLQDDWRAYEWLTYEEDRKGDPPTAEDLAAAQRHIDAVELMRRSHPSGGATIPAFKFGSNDGWVVTPDEIVAALAECERHDLKAPLNYPDLWDRWIAYLRLAAEHDGFAVW